MSRVTAVSSFALGRFPEQGRKNRVTGPVLTRGFDHRKPMANRFGRSYGNSFPKRVEVDCRSNLSFI